MICLGGARSRAGVDARAEIGPVLGLVQTVEQASIDRPIRVEEAIG
jgi:hypothetical protein